MDTRAILCGVVPITIWAVPACALRPFDGTDADVAQPGVVGLEFGYSGYLREGLQKSVIAPAAVLNVGLEHDNEREVEARVRHRMRPEAGKFKATAEGVTKVGDVPVGANAHTTAVDPATHEVFLPLKEVGKVPVLRVMRPAL